MEEGEIVVDVEASHLSESIKHELNKLWGGPNETENFTIFRTPRNIQQSKKNLFEPSVISIGPFHHGQTSLRTMEGQKWRFLRDFLSRGDHISVDFCISEMKLLEEKTRRCYSETVDLDSNDFVKMMLLDGCFVLEFFLKHKEEKWDTISEVGWNTTFVQSDLFLLENQIPFFVVEKLCEIGVKQEDRKNLFLLDNLIHHMSPLPNSPLISKPPAEIDHLAHLFHHCSVPNLEKPSSSNPSFRSKSFHLTTMLSPNRIKDLLLWFLSWVLTRFSRSTSTGDPSTVSIPCISYLQDAGIKFRPKSTPQHMFDISFDHGVLEIPKLKIIDHSKPLLVNLIAFEQCKYNKINVTYFSSYAAFLDLLVSTQKDMAILQNCGIIESMLSGEEELTLFFNQLFDGVSIEEDHVFADLFTKLNRYCESSWKRHRAKLIRDYFSSPWTMISLVAALVLLVFTFLQSFFAVYAYFVPPS
ncbi:UPF0481 protein At3g47200-like [Carex rostrata]